MDLSWKVTEIRYGCSNNSGNWVSVNPSMGNGDATPTVNITAATSPDDCPSATIFISASTGQIQSVPVTRCIPECSCKSLDFKALSVAEQEADGSPSVQIGTFNTGCSCSAYAHVDVDGVVLCNPTSGGGNIYATVNPNEDEQARSGWFRFRYNGNICVDTTYVAQKAKESKCAGEEECDVDPHAPSKFSSAEQTFDVSISKCWDVTEITIEDSSMVTDVEWKCDDCGEGNLGRAVYTISLSENTSTDRTTRVIFDLVNVDTGEVCESDDRIVTINQSGSYVPPTPTECSCNLTPKGLKATDTGEVTIATWSSSNCEGTATVELVDGGGDSECSKEANITQAGTNTCYYTLDNTFSITCDTSTNKQMLSYSVTNGNECSDKSSSQDFTIKLGNGNTYTVSGKPNDNKKQEVEISDSTTTVEWHNIGDESVSGKSSSFNVEQCQSEETLNFTFNMQTSDQNPTGYYFSSFQISFGIKDSSGTIHNINNTAHSLRFDEECSKANALWVNNTANVSSDVWKSAYETDDIRGISLTGAKFVISVVNRGVLKKNGETKPGTYSCDTSYGGQLNTSNCKVYGLGSPLSPTSSSGLPVFEYPINSESDINGKTITLELAPKTN